MRFKWMKRHFTFMVIPDANSGIVRFRVRGLILYLIPIVLLVLVILTLSLYIIQLKSQGLAENLKKELSGQQKEFQFTVTDKNETIDQLQGKLLQFSQQAQEIQGKIMELQKLENDVKSMTGGTSGNTKTEPKNPAEKPGVGGAEMPVAKDAIPALVEETQTHYTNLGQETAKLYENLAGLRQQVQEAQQRIQESERQLRMTPTIWPTDSRYVTSLFGYRRDPFTYRPSLHNGIDIGGALNDPVYATAEGTVVATGEDSTHGRNVTIRHGAGIQTWYMHLNKILVNEGDKVVKGQQIALMGNTGRSTGVHLHYSVLTNGEAVDPRPYMDGSGKEGN